MNLVEQNIRNYRRQYYFTSSDPWKSSISNKNIQTANITTATWTLAQNPQISSKRRRVKKILDYVAFVFHLVN